MKFDYSSHSPNRIEVFPFDVDHAKLRACFEKEVLPRPMIERSPAFGGWSILSNDGTYQNGMDLSYIGHNGPGNKGPSWFPKKPEHEGCLTVQDFDKPTEICTGYIGEIVQRLQDLGFHPRRGRIFRLRARSETIWHVDAPSTSYACRFHIPIITNPHCTLHYEDESFHMAPDGNAYLIDVSRKHMIQNRSDEHRYHLVIAVWDLRGITRFHKYDTKLPY